MNSKQKASFVSSPVFLKQRKGLLMDLLSGNKIKIERNACSSQREPKRGIDQLGPAFQVVGYIVV